jgi:hypothetical protein
MRNFLRCAVIQAMPAGVTPDKAADFSYFALLANINAYAEGLATIVTAGTNTLLTTAQLLAKNIVLTSGASGAFTITLPATSAIISALGATIPTDGTFYFPLYISNQGVGQTGTLTAGDSSTTVSATENSLATNVSGKWMVQVATATTLVVTRVFAGDA